MSQATEQPVAQPVNGTWGKSRMLALWIVIGSVVLAGLTSVIAIVLGQFGTLVWNTIFTVFALGVFAFFAWVETFAAERRPVWETAGVVGMWGVVLLLWTIKIWLHYGGGAYVSPFEDNGFVRFFQAIAIAGVARLAFLLAQVILHSYRRYAESALSSIVAIVAVALATLEAVLLIVPMMLSPWVDFGEFYGKAILITLVLAAVATGLVPLVRLAVRRSGKFNIPEPAVAWGSKVKADESSASENIPVATDQPKLLPWPRFPDGTPLPMGPDGQPDFSAPKPPIQGGQQR